jgi:hypothetical protein
VTLDSHPRILDRGASAQDNRELSFLGAGASNCGGSFEDLQLDRDSVMRIAKKYRMGLFIERAIYRFYKALIAFLRIRPEMVCVKDRDDTHPNVTGKG